MTLRDKFKPKVSINTDGEAGRYAEECEKIADDYAIEFGEWLEILSNSDYGTNENYIYQKFDVTALLEIFKKEKGL
jgi:predicted secreted acid phosphatase